MQDDEFDKDHPAVRAEVTSILQHARVCDLHSLAEEMELAIQRAQEPEGFDVGLEDLSSDPDTKMQQLLMLWKLESLLRKRCQQSLRMTLKQIDTGV